MGEETHRVCFACFPLGLENGDVDVAQQFPLPVKHPVDSVWEGVLRQCQLWQDVSV